MFHLSGNDKKNKEYDTHEHLGKGYLKFEKIKSFLLNDALITL